MDEVERGVRVLVDLKLSMSKQCAAAINNANRMLDYITKQLNICQRQS